MVGIYFSGTGNTQHCVEEFVKQFNYADIAISIEDPGVCHAIDRDDMLVFGYPVYFSNAPKIVQDFINDNHARFQGKKIFIIATIGLFSGDGTGCTARLFKKYGATVVGGLHLKMPDCIGDEKLLKKSDEEKVEIINEANRKIAEAVKQIKAEKPPQDGISFFCHLAGLFGQRLWFYRQTVTYKKKPHVNGEKCIGCGRCAELCPMKNIKIEKNRAVSHHRCTMCYRCFSHCPTQALTILGKKVYEQYLFQHDR